MLPPGNVVRPSCSSCTARGAIEQRTPCQRPLPFGTQSLSRGTFAQVHQRTYNDETRRTREANTTMTDTTVKQRLISADSHVTITMDAFLEHLAKKYLPDVEDIVGQARALQ